MKLITLLYHDVVDPQGSQQSGFSSADAEIYKICPRDFERHLDAIASTGRVPHRTIHECLDNEAGTHPRVVLTFDDGGDSALSTSDLLDRRGWKGHFFIPTDYIDTPGFLNKCAVRSLHTRGHVVGSHSCSHPPRITDLDDERLGREWSQSVQVLQEILGAPVNTASVPSGFYSPRVGELARRAGIRILFNSEPSVRVYHRGEVVLCGRFGLQRETPADRARALVLCDRSALLREAAFWNAKKILKAAGGSQWLAFRKWWFARS